MTPEKWSEQDNKAAMAEGWAVFEIGGTTNAPLFDIQRIDDPEAAGLPFENPKFASDTEAWVHVVVLAKLYNSDLHKRALAFVKESERRQNA
jgi:hypothetical protein